MQLMTEEEARSIMKAHGWSYKPRIRHKSRILYIYGQRREGKRVVDRYICPFSDLDNLTEQDLVEKLAPQETSSAEREPEAGDATDPLTPTDE